MNGMLPLLLQGHPPNAKIKCYRMHFKIAWNKPHIDLFGGFFNHCGKGKIT